MKSRRRLDVVHVKGVRQPPCVIVVAACVGERVRVGRVCDVCTLGGRQRVWVCVCVCDVRACTCVCVGACGSDHLGCLREVGRHGGLGEQQQGTRR